MYRTILVPFDGSAFGELALPVALSIARRAGAAVRLAHVHVVGQSVYGDTPAIVHTDPGMQALATERAYLEELAQRAVQSHAVRVECVLLDGPVADALCDDAKANDVDLMIMSTHGRGALGRMRLGSVAAVLVRQASVPILLVRPREPLAPPDHEPVLRHILIPLDGSPLAEQAIVPAAALGALMEARYTLFHALDPLVIQHTHPPYAAGPDPQLSAELQANATAYLEQLAERLRAQSMQVQTSLVVGPPALSICDYANAHAVDLIAMATHGHGGLSQMLLGSVTDAVVHTADVPVLLSRPPDNERSPS
jgi:nucleotide-binding universal stress UspA family protein